MVAPKPEPTAQGQVFDMSFTSMVTSRALYAAAKLGIADLLAGGPRASDDIAGSVGGNPDGIYRLLRMLASAGVFEESPTREFSLTNLGEVLRGDHPSSLRQWVIFCGEPFYVSAWAEILYSVQTGRPAWEEVHKLPFFPFLASNRSAALIFDQAMTSLSRIEAAAVADAYDFSWLQSVVDVGGGHGMLTAVLLKRNPTLRGVVYDQPQVAEGSRTLLAEEGVLDRADVVGGDFFAEVPGGHDAYLLKYIVHDWDDEDATRILAACRRAIRPDSRVLLIETVVPGPGVSHFAKVQDLEMLVLLGSRERTQEEYARLLARAGLLLHRILPTSEPLSIIEAVPE